MPALATIERRTLPGAELELRIADGTRRPTLTGYAAVFDSRSELIGGDFYEVIKRGAFSKTLSSGRDVIAKLEHEGGEKVLGRTSSGTLQLREDSHGLHATIFPPATTVGKDVIELVRRGDLRQMSFSFTIPKGGGEWSTGSGGENIQTLREVVLHDVSIVATPAYSTTSVSVRRKRSAVSLRSRLERQKKKVRAMKHTQIDRRACDPKLGFRSLGHWAQTIANVTLNATAAPPDDRRALTAYGAGAVGAEGGFAIPPAFGDKIDIKLGEQSQLLELCDQIVITSNTFAGVLDSDPPWNPAGATAYWLGEAAAPTQTKPSLEMVDMQLHKMIGVLPVSDELLDDAVGLSSYIARKLAGAGGYLLDRAILAGTGAATPLGVLNSPALKSVAKVASQVADTVTGINVGDMWKALYAPSKRRGVWICHPDCEEQLLTLMKVGKLDTGAADTGWGVPVSVYDGQEMLRRPVFTSEACEALGDKGDIYLCDFSEYLLVRRTPKLSQSIHVWFDQGTTAFKFIMRVAGQPWWTNPVTSRVGSGERSPFVALDERA